MSTNPLFDLSKCDVPFIESVDFRFISECSIKPPPPPIFDCPEPPKTFRVVPECPSIAGSVMVSADAAGCITPRKNIVVTKTARCGGNEEAGCDFFIDLDLAIPVPVPPCPSIGGGSVKTSVFYEGCKTPKNSIKITPRKASYNNCEDKKSKPGCIFNIDIDLDIPIPRPPCPSITGGSIRTSTFFKGCRTPKNSIKIREKSLPKNCETSKPTCQFAIDIDLDIPIPRPPCPSISGGSVSVSVTLDNCKKKNKITVRKKEKPENSCASNKPNCAHTIDLDLTIPVPLISCPSIQITTEPAPRASITRKKIKTASCGNALRPPRCEFKINIPPPPCPVISAGSASIKLLAPDKKPSIKLKTNQKPSVDSCQFTVDLDIAIPRPPCPSISVGSASIKELEPGKKPSVKLQVKKKESTSECAFTIDLDIAIPKPACGSISVGSASIKELESGKKPSVKLQVKKKESTSACAFTIDLDIGIPKPPCPEISVSKASIKELEPGRKPSVKLTTKKLAPKSGSSCRFAIDLEIGVPVPPCPEISVSRASIKELKPYEKPSVKLKTTKRAPKSGSSCRFALDLELGIPLPPPCVKISVGSQSIKELPPGKKPSVKLKPRKLPPKSGSSCQFALDIDIGIPVPPCPEFSQGSQSIKELEPGKKPSVKLKPRKLAPKSGSSCRFALDIDIRIPVPPCPDISIGSASVKELEPYKKPSVKLATKKLAPKSGSSCRFAIDLEIGIPLPPPCVRISRGSQSITQLPPGEKPSVRLTPRKLPPKSNSSCNYAFDIDIRIPAPPCPEISQGSQSIKELEPGKKPSVKLKARKLEPKSGSSCRFALDIDIGIPVPPCPEISVSKASIKELEPGRKPSVRLKTTKRTPKSGSSCRFAIDLEIGIPVPPCPEISQGSQSIKELEPGKKPSVKLKARKLEPKSGSSCRFALDIDIGIPVPPCPEISVSKASIKELEQGRKPSIRLKTTKRAPKSGSSCRFAIDLEIGIPVPPCPEFSQGSQSIKELPPGEKPSVKLIARKLPPKSGSSCRFALDIDIGIPVPPCPEISVSKASIKELEPGRKPSIRFKTKKRAPKSGSSCRFAIDLEIGIPVPPCPEFSQGSQSIKELPPGEKPSVKLKPRKLAPKSGSSCRFALDIEIGIPVPPCPEFSQGSQSIKELEPGKKPSVKLKARKLEPKSGSSCRFALDIDIGIPLPPCPEISVSRASIKELEQGRRHSVRLKTTKRAPKSGSSCRFAIDLEIGIPVPPCPEISAGEFVVSIGDPEEYKKPSGQLSIRKKPPKSGSSCRFAIDFDLTVPVPKQSCPSISIRGRGGQLRKFFQAETPEDDDPLLLPGRCNYTIDASYASVRASKGTFNRVECPEKDSIKITVTKKVEDLNYTYFLKPEIWVQKQKAVTVKKGTVSCAWVDCTEDKPAAKMSIRKEAGSCSVDWFIDLEIKIPRPPSYVGGTIDLGGYGTGNIEVGSGCERTITGTITLNTTACPEPGDTGGGGSPI